CVLRLLGELTALRSCLSRCSDFLKVLPATSGVTENKVAAGINPAALATLARAARAEDLFDLALDLLEVHELAVHGREADVRDLVEVAQAIHHHLADLAAGDLDPARAPQFGLDVVDDRPQALGGDVALLGRLLQAGEELLGVEVLAAPVLLGDVERHRLDALIRGEALPALQAFTPAADRLPGLGGSGVDHLQVVVPAVRAPHGLRMIPTNGCGETRGC